MGLSQEDLDTIEARNRTDVGLWKYGHGDIPALVAQVKALKYTISDLRRFIKEIVRDCHWKQVSGD